MKNKLSKEEYEDRLVDNVIANLHIAEYRLKVAYQEFLKIGPKSVAKEFGAKWKNIFNQIEQDIQCFGSGVEKRYFEDKK